MGVERVKMTKDGMFMQSVLMFVSASLQENDTQSLRRLQIPESAADRIKRLSMTELLVLGEMASGHFVDFSIDWAALSDALDLLDQVNRYSELIERLIEAEAPLEMMTHFFGMRKREYSTLRQRFGLCDRRGRFRRAKPGELSTIQDTIDRSPDGLSARQILNLSIDEHIPIGIIWCELRHEDADQTAPRVDHAVPEPQAICVSA